MNACRQIAIVVSVLSGLLVACASSVVAQEPAPALHQQIDELISRRHGELKIIPAAVSSDDEFVRRAYLDLTGIIPTATQTRAFLADQTSEKRMRLIDELLASPAYPLHMARVFDVMLIERRIPTITSYDVPAVKWRAYLAEAFAENRHWDRMVREILSSDGADEPHAPGVKFFLVRDVAPHQLTRDVGRLFLGVDLQCAQCHDDPRFESYQQADYFGIYAFLQRVTAYRDNDKNISLVGETAAGKTSFVSVFTAKSGETNPRLPGGEMLPDPAIEKDHEYVVKPGPKARGIPTYSRRLKLAELLPRAETRGFSRNIVNRVWAMLLGRGLVHPLDLHHAANPPSHPELLDRLDQWFVAQQFDLKALLKEIMLSQTYQRASVLPDGREVPEAAFAVAPLRGLTPEQLGWSLLQAVGRVERQLQQPAKLEEGLPEWKQRAKKLEPLDRSAQALVTVFAGLPGHPDGEFQPVVDHALHLLNSPTIVPLVRDEPSTLPKRLADTGDIDALADELYLSVLSRRPTSDETAQVREALSTAKSPPDRREPLTALIWGLLLSSEFRLNH